MKKDCVIYSNIFLYISQSVNYFNYDDKYLNLMKKYPLHASLIILQSSLQVQV